ncbi:MAG: leucyl aminopeptidase [Betaproteobacteria bacterium]|nr:MAG: leucyl aminopeptidase [Betaproteobacteria bacterium]
MEFSIKSGAPEKQRSACIVVGVFESRKLSTAAESVDRAADGQLSDILRRGDMEGKLGSTLLLHNVSHLLCDRVLLVGLGREREFRDKEYRDACRAAIRTLNDTGAMEAVVFLTELPVRRRGFEWKLRQAVLVAHETLYRFDRLKSKQSEVRRPLRKLTLSVARRSELTAGEVAMRQAEAVAAGMNLAKDLGNLPPNVCTPTYLAEQAVEIAKGGSMTCEVLEAAEMEQLGMGALLAVARGSVQPPKLIVMRYQGDATGSAPIALVGKGITFDTGGISLKPAAEMDEMKFDMCGAASVLGTMHAIAAMRLPLNVIGLVPSTENMPGGRATKPGDIVKTLSGQSVEILNTDAEGRLILCDALTYCERFQPGVVIDIATLTGACVIALGHVAAGLFANDDALAREVMAAGDLAYDRAWHMPLWDDYQEQLRSNFADMANIGGRPAGSVTAACFLSRFAKNFRWAHLDIAGVAWRSGREKGATGRPVPLLTQFLIDRARDAARTPET